MTEVDRPFTFIRPGHQAGDFLGSSTWTVLEEARGLLRLAVRLPDHVRNPRGQLFGGFAGTYADLVALSTVFAGSAEEVVWLATTAMRIDYLAPVVGPDVVIEGRVMVARDRTRIVEVRLLNEGDEQPAVLASVTLRQLPG